MSLSLYSRAMLLVGASLAVVTVLSTFAWFQSERATLTERLRQRLAEAGVQQAIAVSDALWKLNREGAELVLQGVARDPDFLSARVLDDKGRLFAGVGTTDTPSTLAEKTQTPILLQQPGSRRIGTLELSFSRGRLEAVQQELLWRALQLGLLQLAVVLIATALALRAFIKPLEAITDRMLTVAAGDLTSPIPSKDRTDQLGNIARAVELFAGEMTARREATRELEATQRQLEQRIEDRTRALSESEKRFRGLFDHSPLPKWVYSTADLRFLEVNDAAISQYGYSRAEFLSMTLMDIRPPEEAERLRQWRAQPNADRHRTTNWRHRYKNGQLRDVELFLSDIEFAGEPARLAVVIDITARKEAERQTQGVIETSQDVVIVTDSRGRFLRVSPSAAKVLGYQPEEMVGRTGDAFIHAEDLEPTRAEMRAARAGSASRHFRCRYVHKDGHVVPLVWMSTWSEADQRHFFIGRDMTDYERTEGQLRQAQKMEAVGQLTGGVAHDFNNILMVILANVEALEEEEGLHDELRQRIDGIATATQRAADLTRQLLAFSRKQPLRPKLTDINDLAVSTGRLLRRTLGEQIEIDSLLADGLWCVEVDPAQLESALVNLCINARDAMPDGGRLLIETKNVAPEDTALHGIPDCAHGEHVMLAVTDTGTGMTPEVMSRVFEPFFTTKGVGKGSGLGLSMVYGFIKQSNGHVGIDSKPGSGTTIRLYLPKSEKPLGQVARQQQRATPRGTETILVVEDDPQVRASVVMQLRSLGYSIEQAADGASALAACEAAPRPYDLLLTDVIMPGAINGRRLADEVGSRWPSTKRVLMSGYTENAMMRDGRLEANVLLLNKPFQKRDLALILRQALDTTPSAV